MPKLLDPDNHTHYCSEPKPIDNQEFILTCDRCDVYLGVFKAWYMPRDMIFDFKIIPKRYPIKEDFSTSVKESMT